LGKEANIRKDGFILGRRARKAPTLDILCGSVTPPCTSPTKHYLSSEVTGHQSDGVGKRVGRRQSLHLKV